MVWFETILVVLTLLTGILWLGDKLFFAKRRRQAAGLLDEKEPLLVDYSRAFFPVLAIVLGLRSFVAEPFRIPSSSMTSSWSTSSPTASVFPSTTGSSSPSASPSVATWWSSARRTTPTRTGSSA